MFARKNFEKTFPPLSAWEQARRIREENAAAGAKRREGASLASAGAGALDMEGPRGGWREADGGRIL